MTNELSKKEKKRKNFWKKLNNFFLESTKMRLRIVTKGDNIYTTILMILRQIFIWMRITKSISTFVRKLMQSFFWKALRASSNISFIIISSFYYLPHLLSPLSLSLSISNTLSYLFLAFSPAFYTFISTTVYQRSAFFFC